MRLHTASARSTSLSVTVFVLENRYVHTDLLCYVEALVRLFVGKNSLVHFTVTARVAVHNTDFHPPDAVVYIDGFAIELHGCIPCVLCRENGRSKNRQGYQK